MVEINGAPRIKLSQDVGKVTMPGKKNAYRLYGADGKFSNFNLINFSCAVIQTVQIDVLYAFVPIVK